MSLSVRRTSEPPRGQIRVSFLLHVNVTLELLGQGPSSSGEETGESKESPDRK